MLFLPVLQNPKLLDKKSLQVDHMDSGRMSGMGGASRERVSSSSTPSSVQTKKTKKHRRRKSKDLAFSARDLVFMSFSVFYLIYVYFCISLLEYTCSSVALPQKKYKIRPS